MEGGWLNIDVSVDAHLNRAVACAALERFDDARADLDAAERISPSSARIYAARSYLLNKLGRKKAAQAAWIKAKRINPAVEPFKD